MEQNKISVVTPSFNQGEYIERTIQSVIHQEYNNFEHIVIDGGSTDSTINILKKYNHLKWVSERDKGQSHALNKGLRKATGEIICWLNSDDTLCKNAFNIVNREFNKNKKTDIVIGGKYIIDENDNIIRNDPAKVITVDSLLNKLGSVQQQSTFFKKKLLEECGYIDENIKCCMDHDLFIRFFLKGHKPVIIEKYLANFRIYADTKTSQLNKQFIKDKLNIKRKYGGSIIDIYTIRAFLRLHVVLNLKSNKQIYSIYQSLLKRKKE